MVCVYTYCAIAQIMDTTIKQSCLANQCGDVVRSCGVKGWTPIKGLQMLIPVLFLVITPASG